LAHAARFAATSTTTFGRLDAASSRHPVTKATVASIGVKSTPIPTEKANITNRPKTNIKRTVPTHPRVHHPERNQSAQRAQSTKMTLFSNVGHAQNTTKLILKQANRLAA
jgi:hypothetical protein